MKQGALIECRSLCKAFSGRIALDNVDLSIGRGRIVGLLGPNGSGKTTLIKLMNGLINPTKGELFIDGQKPGPYTKSVISYLPDRPYFADWMTVKDVLNMFMDFYKDFDADKAQQMCASSASSLTVGKAPPMGYLPAMIPIISCSLSCGHIGLLSSSFQSIYPPLLFLYGTFLPAGSHHAVLPVLSYCHIVLCA